MNKNQDQQSCSCELLNYKKSKDFARFNLVMIFLILLLIVVIIHIFNMKAEYSDIFSFMNSDNLPPTSYSPWKISLSLYMPWVAKLIFPDPFINPSTPLFIRTLISTKWTPGQSNSLTPWSLFGPLCIGACNGSDCPDTTSCLQALGLLDSNNNPIFTPPSSSPLTVIPSNARIVSDWKDTNQGGQYGDQGFNMLSVVFGGFVSLSENNANMSVAELYDYCFFGYPPPPSSSTCSGYGVAGNFIKNIVNYGSSGLGIGAMMGMNPASEVGTGGVSTIAAVGGLLVGGAIGAGISAFSYFTNTMQC